MSTPADKLTALGFSAQQAELLIATFAASGAPVAAPPFFSPAGGSYATPQTVAISATTPNSAIYFTEDGSTPTFPPTGTTQEYSNAIQVAANTTIQAIVVASGYQDSPVQVCTYVISSSAPQTTIPTVNPVAGPYSSAQTVSLSCVTAGASIYYTLDGSTPTIASTMYAAPFTVSASTVVKAIAIAPGFNPSGVLTASFVIQVATAAAPTFAPAGGTYTSTQTVTLSCASPSPSIYYTLDGTTPTYPISGTTQLYSGTISVSASETITAIATSSGLANSAPSNAQYVITTQAAAPTFSPAAGTYANNQSVALSGPSGSTIYYTTDGSTPTFPPTGTTQLYTAPIPVPPVTSPVNAPTFSPAAGTYTGAQSVSILSPAGSVVYYTTDGSTPTTSSAVYSSAITVSASETLKAIATNGGLASSVASAAYVINTSGGGGTGVTPVFNFPNFNSTTGLNTTPGNAEVTGGTIQLIPPGSAHVAACTWWNQLVNISGGFTLDYSCQFTNMTTIPSIIGMAAVVQNTTSPPGAAGYVGASFNGDANVCGYGCFNPANYTSGQYPPVNSVALKLDADQIETAFWNVNASGVGPSSTGYYENGGTYNGLLPANDLAPDGINLYAGNVLKIHIVYDGAGTIVQTITDTVTGAQCRLEWPSNVQNALSNNSGYVGWTAGHALNNGSTSTPAGVTLFSASLSTGYLTRNSAVTFSPAAGQYSGSQTITLSGPSGATIYYTTNGRNPTTASTQYTGPFTLTGSAVVKAIAVQSGYTDSLIASASYQIGTVNRINFPTGLSQNAGLITVGSAVWNGSQVDLTNGSTTGQNWTGEMGGLQWGAPVPVTTFSAAFTLKFTSVNGGTGTAFVLHNNPPAKSTQSTARSWPAGMYAIGGNDNSFGQGAATEWNGKDNGFLNDAAVGFDLRNNSVSFASGGADLNSNQIATGMNFATGNPINCTLNYDGTNLVLGMADPIAGTSFSHTWTPVNIPALVGGTTAYPQITASTFYNLTAVQSVTKWTM